MNNHASHQQMRVAIAASIPHCVFGGLRSLALENQYRVATAHPSSLVSEAAELSQLKGRKHISPQPRGG